MLNVLDLFSGIGGFSYGLKKAGGFNTVAFCEIDEPCRKVLKKHWADIPIYEDVKLLNSERIGSDGISVDVICGGFPCQDISIAGKGAGLSGEKSGLWFEFYRLIEELKPRFAIVENVFAFRNRGLDCVLQDLASIGYDATWTLYDSKYFGVPQRRRRIYILAVRDGIPADSDVFEHQRRDRCNTTGTLNDYNERRKSDIAETGRIGKAIAYFTRQRSDEYAVTGLSSTLTKRDYKSYTDLVVHADGTVRRVMPHERLRLQGYPDDYFDDLALTDTHKFKMNGMTSNVIKYIGERINETFQI